MKKTLAIILALVSILTFTMATTQAEEEKRVLTIGSTVQMGDFWEYDSFKKVQEELNMEIDCTYYSEDSMAPMLAGGALPDIVITSSNLIKPDKVVSNKLALDIAPYLEQYAPNMLSPSYATAMKFSKETMSDDGDSVYIICPCVGTHNVNGGTRMMGRGYVVNWEYYKELGCPEIKNDDDYLDVLLRMRENHPTTEDGSPMFLMGVEKNFTDMGGYRACFLKDVSLNAWTPYFYKNNIFTNELVNCYTDFEKSSYWHDMEFYNKVYRNDGFDIDSFTMTYDEYAAKVDKHQYLGLYFGGSEDTYVAVPCEGANFYANIPLFTGQAPDRYAFISANSQNYDLALAFYNYMYDLDFCRMHYSGIQGTDWDYNEEGVPALTDASMEAIKNNDPYWSSNVEQGGKGYGDRVQAILGYNPGVAHTDGYPLNLQLMRDAKVKTQDELHTDVANTYGVECWSDAYTENENIKDFRNSGEGLGGMIEMPKDYQRTLEACNDVLYTAMPMLVMAESEEEFAEVREETLQEIADLGENEVWEWYQSAWEEPKEFYNALIKESIETQGMEPYEGLE